MKSFTVLRNLYGSLTLDASATNLTLGDQLINDELRHLYSLKDWPFMQRSETVVTVSGTHLYRFPVNSVRVDQVTATVSGRKYPLRIVHSKREWDMLTQISYSSDITSHCFVYDDQIDFYPTPATSSNVITVYGKALAKDLTQADVTVTVTAATNGSTAVTLSSGALAAIAGMWIRIGFATSANSGDGKWYEISSAAPTAGIVLVKPYAGTSIAAGSASATIAQMPFLPEEWHDLPVFKAAETYWMTMGNPEKAQMYGARYAEGVASMVRSHSSASGDYVLGRNEDERLVDPNLYVTLP